MKWTLLSQEKPPEMVEVLFTVIDTDTAESSVEPGYRSVSNGPVDAGTERYHNASRHELRFEENEVILSWMYYPEPMQVSKKA